MERIEAEWTLARRQALPKNLDKYKKLQQNTLFFDNNGSPEGLSYRDLQWNNTEKEFEAIPDSIFRFWDQNDVKEQLFQCMETNWFLQTQSIHFKV